MISENMKKVLVALRSGEYTQTTSTLQDSRGHCCLGVMCEVYEKETGDKIKRDFDDYIKGRSLLDLPKVQQWVGLTDTCGTYLLPNGPTSLAQMNDRDGKSLSEIADFIESEPTGLLV
jgi:hypothetical protein